MRVFLAIWGPAFAGWTIGPVVNALLDLSPRPLAVRVFDMIVAVLAVVAMLCRRTN